MRKPFSTSFSILVSLALLIAAGCAPTQENGVGLPSDQNPIQAVLTATTLTPATMTPVFLSTDTPTLVIVIPTTLSSTPTVDEQAVVLAQQLAPQFNQIFGVQFVPSLAKGLDAARIGGPAGQLAQMIAPVIDGNQRYTDRNYEVREVEGILSLNDSRLDLEAMNIINKGTIQYFPVPLGAYMVACHAERPNDCLAVSLHGEEFQVGPDTISIIPITPPPIGTPPPPGPPPTTGMPPPTGTACPIGMPCPTGTPPPYPTPPSYPTATLAPDAFVIPIVGFEEGSIRTCFWVFRRKICIRVFR